MPTSLRQTANPYGKGQAEQYEDESKSLIGFLLEGIIFLKVII
jgi:hypothetical protein